MKKSLLVLLPAVALIMSGCSLGGGDATSAASTSGAAPTTAAPTTAPTTTGTPTGTSTSEVDPTNYGSLDNPLTVTEALAIAAVQCQADGQITKQRVYTTGIVVGGNESNYGWNRFYIAESLAEGAAQLYAYSVNKDESGKMGYPNDTVIVEGFIKNYQGTIEYANSAQGVQDYPTFAKIERGTSAISVTAEHATVNGLDAEALNASDQEFTVTADANYEVVKVEANGKELTATEGVYKFVVKGDMAVVVTTKESGQPEDQVLAEFTCGPDGEASHNDGTGITDGTGTYEETVGTYTLVISNPTKVSKNARDLLGHGCLKLGTSSIAGSFELVLPEGVDYAVLLVGGYKFNDAVLKINGGEDITVSKHSSDGEYAEIEAEEAEGKITFALQDGGKRCMINGIRFMKRAA